MHKPVVLRLTRSDLRHGKKNNCNSCPVARAINRHLIEGFSAEVHPRYIAIVPDEDVYPNDWAYSFFTETDAITCMFVDAFDSYDSPFCGVADRKLVKPGYLTTLYIPEEFLHVG